MFTPPPVLPDRDCGSCHACCVSLTIEDPELQKAQGYRCKNLQDGLGCRIYAQRPETCSTFNCGWRIFKWIKPAMRPDQSGVIVTMTVDKGELGVQFLFLRPTAVRSEGLAESIAAAVAAGYPVYLSVSGPPGYTAARARIDQHLAQAVATKNKAAVLDFLKMALRKSRAGERVPIRFTSKTPA